MVAGSWALRWKGGSTEREGIFPYGSGVRPRALSLGPRSIPSPPRSFLSKLIRLTDPRRQALFFFKLSMSLLATSRTHGTMIPDKDHQLDHKQGSGSP